MDHPHDIYFSADIETDGPIPGRFSMLSFGMAVAGRYDGTRFARIEPESLTFYRELKPISHAFDAETVKVSGLDRAALVDTGATPEEAMTAASEWVSSVAGRGTPVLVAYPKSFDWSWLWWYFVAFSRVGSPFRFSNCFDIKTAFAVKSGRPISLSGASRLPSELRSHRPHRHHALADAVEQADIFANLLEWNGTSDDFRARDSTGADSAPPR
jgi:hypothetical protein